MRATDISLGHVHGRWTILSAEFRRDTKSGKAWFSARCSCGTEREIGFKGGFISKSCGCLQREVAHATHTIHGASRTPTGKEPLYRVWQGIKDRCYNPARKEYGNYGGRGIEVCPEWRNDFSTFRSWALANGYRRGLDLNREDNDGPYAPWNCAFVTRRANLNNTRWNRLLTAFGETKTMANWSEDARCILDRKGFEARIRLGWDAEDALVTPKNNWNPARKRR